MLGLLGELLEGVHIQVDDSVLLGDADGVLVVLAESEDAEAVERKHELFVLGKHGRQGERVDLRGVVDPDDQSLHLVQTIAGCCRARILPSTWWAHPTG